MILFDGGCESIIYMYLYHRQVKIPLERYYLIDGLNQNSGYYLMEFSITVWLTFLSNKECNKRGNI